MRRIGVKTTLSRRRFRVYFAIIIVLCRNGVPSDRNVCFSVRWFDLPARFFSEGAAAVKYPVRADNYKSPLGRPTTPAVHRRTRETASLCYNMSNLVVRECKTESFLFHDYFKCNVCAE